MCEIVENEIFMHYCIFIHKRCFGQVDGYKYTNPGNCAEFFTCSAGQSYLQRCPAKLYFNQQRQECDYAENVQCNGAPAEPVSVRQFIKN